MPPRRFSPDSPKEWLNRAHSNLIFAKAKLPGVYLEDLCFNAQQAAEKAIKAVLMNKDIEFPYIHDLAGLLTLLEQTKLKIPKAIKEAARLTRYAVAFRYPSFGEAVTKEEYEEAVVIAKHVVDWADKIIGGLKS